MAGATAPRPSGRKEGVPMDALPMEALPMEALPLEELTLERAAGPTTLRALVVDDEAPAREELTWLLGRDANVASVRSAGSAPEALRALELDPVDVVFC